MACHPASAEASARARASCWRLPGRREYRRLVSIWPMWAVQLARDGGGAEAAVQEPDVVGLALQDADDGGVDAPGRGDLPEQVGVLAGAGDRAAARR